MVAGPNDSVVRAVERWVRRQPDAVAISGGGEEVTYGALWLAAQGWAAALRTELDRSGQAEPVVAVLRPRDVHLPAALLGVWLAGAAYLPLDPTLPDGRIGQILSSAGCAAVLTTDALVHRVGGPPPVTAPAEPAFAPGPVALAYVLYTSGSTGTPKGVEIEHPGLSELLDWYGRRFRFAPGTRIAMTAGVGFDQSVLDVWGTLVHGATLVLPDARLAADVDAVVTFLDTERIDHCYLPAALAEQLFGGTTWPSTLRSLDVGGEALRRWPPTGFPCAVHNGYGPTETTIVATISGDLRGYPSIGAPPIGCAVAGLALALVDDSGARVDGPGQEGELLVSGTGLARGYRHDPVATSSAFIFQDGQRWYRTGDICGWTDAGELVFVGRRDGQVKVHGHRIELGEVEHALLRCAEVRQAAAAAVGEGHRRALHAWIVGSADPAVVRSELAVRLPGSMVPAAVHVVPALPMTPNGKVDRAALAAATSESAQPPDVPEYLSGTEEAVAGVWAEVLGRWPARGDEFFAIGGNSLAAAKVTARLRSVLGVTLTLATLLEHPALREYAGEVDTLLRAHEGNPVDRPTAFDRHGPQPLSYLQENRLTKELRARGAGRSPLVMFVPLVVELRGAFSDDQVEAAVNAVVARHESLRTGFWLDPQRRKADAFVATYAPLRMERRPLDGYGEEDRFALVVNEHQRLVSTPLNLAEPPLCRASLCRFDVDHAVLVLVVDHLLIDGWTGDVLFDELCAALDGTLPAEAPPLQHLDWVVWQRRRLDGPDREPLVRYWRGALAGTQLFPPLPVPAPAHEAEPGRVVRVATTDPAQTGGLLAELARLNATPLMAALHAVTIGWSVVTGERDMVLHMPTANRSLPEFEPIVGWLAHSVVLRMRPDPSDAPERSFDRTRTAVLDALRNQDIPLPVLVRELQPDAYGHARRRDRLFFTYEPTSYPVRRVVGGQARRLGTPDQESIAEPGVSFYSSLTDDRLRIEVVTDPATVDQRFAAELTAAIGAALHGFTRMGAAQLAVTAR